MKWSHPEPGEDSKWPLSQQKPFVKHFSALSLSHASLTHKYTTPYICCPFLFYIHKFTVTPPSLSLSLVIAKDHAFLSCFSNPRSFVFLLWLVCFHSRLFPYTSISRSLLLRHFIVSLSHYSISPAHALVSFSYSTLSSFFSSSVSSLALSSLSLTLFFFVSRSLPLPAGVQQGHWNLQPNKDSLRKTPSAFQRAV